MDIFDQILENLELERELGTRVVEIDRALLAPPGIEAPAVAPPAAPEPELPKPAVEAGGSAAAAVGDGCDILFLTGSAPSPQAKDALDRTFSAMRRIRAGLRICLNEERKAKVVVLLGSDALKKRLPTARPVRGAWVVLDGTPAMMTFSPDYIFSHFQRGSSRMDDAKRVMWNDIKTALARIVST